MEERLPAGDKALPLPLPPGRAEHETYVVQIPRDNVCRVPPPEHARIVEEHVRKAAVKMAPPRRRRFRCSLALPIFLIVVVITIAILTARSTLFRPIRPAFSVTRIRQSNSTRRVPEFRLSIRAENRNPWMTVNYLGGGAAGLIFQDNNIATGNVPATIAETQDSNANFAVVLPGKPLPKDVKAKLTGDGEKYLEFTMDMNLEMRSYFRNDQFKLHIYCDFRVRNSLTKNNNISLQTCVSTF